MYFLCSSEYVFVGNLFLCARIYIWTKIIHLMFYFLKKKCKKLRLFGLINIWFSINTKWWTVPASFIEANTIAIAFNSFSQLRPNLTSYFQFTNKLNFTFMHFIIFIFITFASSFYLFVYRYIARSVARTLLTYTNYELKGFFVESCCRIVRNFIKGFIHAYFILNYRTQLVCLIASDIFFILISVIFSKSFKKLITRILFVLYYILFFIFDTLLYIYYYSSVGQ